ncbi:TRPL translocation defect protein 14 [Diplonema papillatum]|nr:TRPL translocation defect protein 14 [Diplonema papillatum]
MSSLRDNVLRAGRFDVLEAGKGHLDGASCVKEGGHNSFRVSIAPPTKHTAATIERETQAQRRVDAVLSQAPAPHHPRESAVLKRIVITGGPCGGKTTALPIIANRLRSNGWQVFTVPENATIFSNAGAGFPVHSHKEHQLAWETSRMICQMQMEDCFAAIAQASGKPTIILCDRGVIDARAYMDAETWEKLLRHMGWRETELRDRRYDMILHMVTTAVGARQHYVNTVYRHETPDQAAELDDKVKDAWIGHSSRCIFDNSTGFEDKVNKLVRFIARA